MTIDTASAELNLHCWDGYDQPDFIAEYSSESGVQLHARALISDHDAAMGVLRGNSKVDILNINNPYPAKILYPAGRIVALDEAMLPARSEKRLPWINHLEQWSNADSGQPIGICQRFGAFNLVVNTDKLSPATATQTGFRLVEETRESLPYGVLLFPEFNLFHICIAANLNPFSKLDANALDRFERTARLWINNASLVTSDSHALNQALISGEISYFLSGGVFTSASARLAGHRNIRCITPDRGPIGGKGAIAFMEVTSITADCKNADAAHAFLSYLLRPDVAHRIATNPDVCNPVAQMADPRVFDLLSPQFLDAIQWQDLEEDISRCATYDIPPDYDALIARLSRVLSAKGSS